MLQTEAFAVFTPLVGIQARASPYRKAAAQEPSEETMQGPIGLSGVQARPKSGQSSGARRPSSTRAQPQPAGTEFHIAGRPKRAAASKPR